jgi:3-hydroxyisobutyrate dehydrogenase-like beta-hydroxyacid dehydrogenase
MRRSSIMSDVSVIGVGAMGAAITRVFRTSGHAVTCWNRSTQKMEPLVAEGALRATTVADAVAASPVIVACVDSYARTRDLLGAGDVADCLAGRTLLEVATDTSQQARITESWAAAHGARFLPCMVYTFPPYVGSASALIMVAGQQAVFEAHRPLIDCLGGDVRYLGGDVGAVGAATNALNASHLATIMGAVQAAALCEAEGVGVDVLGSLLGERNPATAVLKLVLQQRYEDPGTTIRVWRDALQRMQEQCRDTGVDAGFAGLLTGLCDRAIEAGRGDLHFAAMLDILRSL